MLVVIGLVIVGCRPQRSAPRSGDYLIGRCVTLDALDRRKNVEVLSRGGVGDHFFFIGLFILVGGLVELGVINWMAQSLLDLT